MKYLIIALLAIGFILICLSYKSFIYPLTGCILFVIAMGIEDRQEIKIRNNADEDRPE